MSAERDGAALEVVSRATVLATGGAAALWARTTNPRGSTGVGLALAHAAGADLADLDFVQFHPTALVSDGPRDGFLVTEAVRGEGATLLGAGGERFVDELAPRDEVALAIESELRSSGAAAVSLDMRSVDLGALPQHRRGAGRGRDRPGARPGAGGARRPLHDGRRGHRPRRPRLDRRAVRGGRVRLHRPARGQPAGVQLAGGVLRPGSPRRLAATAEPLPGDVAGAAAAALPAPPTAGTRAALWRHAGLRRDAEGLAQLAREEFPLARMIARSCAAREESRGAHQRTDHPGTDPALDGRHAVVGASEDVGMEHWE